jgi:hypothetical protein
MKKLLAKPPALIGLVLLMMAFNAAIGALYVLEGLTQRELGQAQRRTEKACRMLESDMRKYESAKANYLDRARLLARARDRIRLSNLRAGELYPVRDSNRLAPVNVSVAAYVRTTRRPTPTTTLSARGDATITAQDVARQ